MSSVQAQPQRGMLLDRTQPSAIVYECRSIDESRITCNFTQLDVYKERHFRTVDQTLGAVSASLNEQRCAAAKLELEKALKKDPGPPAPPGRMRSEQRHIEALKAKVEYCRTGNREDLYEYLTREYERHQKTCTIFAHTYVQTFRREPVYIGGEIHWVTEHAPYGRCEIHRESRFIGGGFSWRYAVHHKVMEKSAQELSCGHLKEYEISYSGERSEEAGWVDCQTVEFRSGCYSPDFPCLGDQPAIVH